MAQYKLTDLSSGVEKIIDAENMNEAREAATDWMREGDWNVGKEDETIWVRCQVEELDADGEPTSSDEVTVSIDPPEPNCIDGEDHDWQSPHSLVGGLDENPGVFGHGGGVVIHTVCMHCGCERITDTWAQDRETGQQGLDSVRYAPGKFASDVRDLASQESE